MLEHCYISFVKSHFASLTKQIAELAASGDSLCRQLMFDAGEVLGRHVSALSRHVDQVREEREREREVLGRHVSVVLVLLSQCIGGVNFLT